MIKFGVCKRLRSYFSIIAVVSLHFFQLASVHAHYGGGAGTIDDPYLIYDPNHMNAISNNVSDWSKHFKLMADIDFSGQLPLRRIGHSSLSFRGSFDGNGFTLSNCLIQKHHDLAGLFGYVKNENSFIKNITIINTEIVGGTVRNGGVLVGVLHAGTIENCHIQNGVIDSNDSIWSYNIGGLVGDNKDSGVITSCTTTEIAIAGRSSIGGLVGNNRGTIIGCSSESDLSGVYAIGGLVGANYNNDIIKCSSRGMVSGDYDIGGLIGFQAGKTVQSCFSDVDVTGDYQVGGFFGTGHASLVRNCYALGNVIGNDKVGGFMGAGYTGTEPRIFGAYYNCFSSGLVAGTTNTGGFLGGEDNSNNYFNCYWDTQTSGQSSSNAGEGKLTSELQDASTYSMWGCGEEVWTLDQGNSYPQLAWENSVGVPINSCPHIFSGSGDPNAPFEISTASEMNFIGSHPDLWDDHYQLVNDINLSSYTGSQFNIIGARFIPFTGVFDGNNKSLINFSYINTVRNNVGLFSSVQNIEENQVMIHDLTLDNPDVKGRFATGSLVGYVYGGKITQCHSVGGDMYSPKEIGGFVGRNDGILELCSSSSGVIGEFNAGGFVGTNFGQIISCHSTGNVTGGIVTAGGRETGGLVGANDGYIYQSYSHCVVVGDNQIGGLVGLNDKPGVIDSCRSSGEISGKNSLGGLVGTSQGKVQSSFSSVQINGENELGGLIGGSSGPVLNCYSVGSVMGNGSVGGLIGSHTWGYIYNCYSTSSVIGSSDTGGLVGSSLNAGNTFYSYWDIETSGVIVSSEGFGKTSAELKMISTFESWGCEETSWMIDEGNDYPRLIWEPNSSSPIVSCDIDFQGAGSIEDPFALFTPDELQAVGMHPVYWDNHFVLQSHLDMSQASQPVLHRIGFNETTPFTGTFNGNGYTISNLLLDAPGIDYIGLFGFMKTDSDDHVFVQKLNIKDAQFTGKQTIGALAGQMIGGKVKNCSVQGGVLTTTDRGVGGLLGRQDGGEVFHCYSTATVLGGSRVHGLIGVQYTDSQTETIATGSFWDKDVSGSTLSDGGIGRSTADMQTADIFLDAGWDFFGEGDNGTDDIWVICESTNYPKFWRRRLEGDIGCPDGVNVDDLYALVNDWLIEPLEFDTRPIYKDRYVNMLDFAVMSSSPSGDYQLFVQEWLKEGPIEDIAPNSGDDILNYIDFSVLSHNWLREY